MKRAALLLGISALAVFILGCQSDPRETTISRIINQVQKASTGLTQVRTELAKTIKKAEKESKKIVKDDLDDTLERIAKLRPVGRDLATLKADADAYKSKISVEEQKAYATQFANRLTDSLSRLKSEQEKLRVTRADFVKLASKKSVELFDDALRAAMQEFEAVTRK